MDKFDGSWGKSADDLENLYKGLTCRVTKIDVWVIITEILGKLKNIEEHGYRRDAWKDYDDDTLIIEVASFEDLEEEYGPQVVEKLSENNRQRNGIIAERANKNDNIEIFALPRPRLECSKEE